MTVITKPITEKKLNKQQQEPLVDGAVDGNGQPMADPERGTAGARRAHVLIRVNQPGRVERLRMRRIQSLTTTCVALTALLVFSMGILSGMYYWRQMTLNRMRHFKGWCSVPYTVEEVERYQGMDTDSMRQDVREALQAMASRLQKSNTELEDDDEDQNRRFFDQQFDLDMEREEYEKIDVPDFSGGRRGKFIHDFNLNKTGIVDLDGGRCFLLELNRSHVLPPSSLFDLVTKMRGGYYDIDTEVVKESYRVITPAINDLEEMGYYIAKECASLPTYRLEKMTTPVFKRSIPTNGQKTMFAEFAGSKIAELDIVNLEAAVGKHWG